MPISVFSRLIYFSIFLLQCRSTVLPRIFVFHLRNVTFVTSSEKCFEFVLCTLSNIGLFQEKHKQGVEGWGHRISRSTKEIECRFPKVSLKRCGISRVDKKKNLNIRWPWFLVLNFSRSIANTTLRYRNSKNEA